MRHVLVPLFVLASAWGAEGQSTPTAVVDRAIERLGGAAALQKIERARFEAMTLWHRQTWEDRPFGDVVGSFERISDLRDYSIPAWRNTRQFIGGGPAGSITDLVRDTVAARQAPTRQGGTPEWAALNIAYVDERKELFTFSPERLLLAAREARDLRAMTDTTIDGVAHARVQATIDGFPSTIHLRRTDGFPAFVRYRAAQPNDFGLAPFGAMEVELWYGQWRPVAVSGGTVVRYPAQFDIARAGRPYKRITILSAKFDLAASPDSFVVSDTLRRAFVATAARPMWDIPLDSGKVTDGRFAVLGPPGFSPNAVRVGNSWVLLEGSSVPERAGRMQAWLATRDPATRLGAMLVSTAGAPRGEAAWFAQQRRPVYLGRGARRGANTVLANWKAPTTTLDVVTKGRWTTFDGDSMWVEPFDAPGVNGGLVAFVPSLRWVYQAMAADPTVRELVLDLAKQRGWSVERLGHVRAVSTPLSTASR